jgi:hypothetical protein
VGLALFADGCALVADHAAGRMVRLAVAAGPALPDLATWLGWLASVGHPNLGLGLNNPTPDQVRQAAQHLFSLRSEAPLPPETAQALREIGYRGSVFFPAGATGTTVTFGGFSSTR